MSRVLSFVAAVLTILTIAAPSAQQRAAIGRPETAPLADAPPLQSKLLPNGLEVIVLSDHSVPLVTVELAVRSGSVTEPPELNGLSHLFEHMFFKSNRATLNREDYLMTIGDLGIAYNGETREEVVTYYCSTTTPNFAVAMRFLRDSARYPAFDAAEFEQEKTIVVAELERGASNPYADLQREMNERLFFRYPSRKTPTGSKQTVSRATTDMMRLIQGRYHVPNNSAVIVTGDVDGADAFRTAEQLFGDWARRPVDPFKEFPLVEHPPLPQSSGAFLTRAVQNIVVEIGWHGPSIGKDDAATYAADVFSNVLRQPDSRLQRALVDTGLVTSIALGYYTQRNVGPITFLFQTTPENARAAVRVFYEQIAHFTDPDYFSDDELEAAKAALEADELAGREKPSDYARRIAFWWASSSLDYYRGYLARLRAISRADINRYVTTYIQGKPHVGVAMLSADALKGSGLAAADLIGPTPPRNPQ